VIDERALLRGLVGVPVALDYGFKQAVATRDQPTIRSALRNHAARAGATVALLLDLDGTVMVSSSGDEQHGRAPLSAAQITDEFPHHVVNIDGAPYQTVTVPVQSPLPVALVMLGFPWRDWPSTCRLSTRRDLRRIAAPHR
jgi:hypothetical protein